MFQTLWKKSPKNDELVLWPTSSLNLFISFSYLCQINVPFSNELKFNLNPETTSLLYEKNKRKNTIEENIKDKPVAGALLAHMRGHHPPSIANLIVFLFDLFLCEQLSFCNIEIFHSSFFFYSRENVCRFCHSDSSISRLTTHTHTHNNQIFFLKSLCNFYDFNSWRGISHCKSLILFLHLKRFLKFLFFRANGAKPQKVQAPQSWCELFLNGD